MPMYWLDLQALKNDLRQGPLAESQAFKYVLAFLLASAAGAGFDIAVGTPGWAPVGVGVICGFGTYICYRANGGAGGNDFLSRYVSLGWVVGVRMIPAAFLMGLLAGTVNAVLQSVSGGPEAARRNLIMEPAHFIWLALMYWRISVHLSDLRQHAAASVPCGGEQARDST